MGFNSLYQIRLVYPFFGLVANLSSLPLLRNKEVIKTDLVLLLPLERFQLIALF
jgi:hypothetical protein